MFYQKRFHIILMPSKEMCPYRPMMYVCILRQDHLFPFELGSHSIQQGLLLQFTERWNGVFCNLQSLQANCLPIYLLRLFNCSGVHHHSSIHLKGSIVPPFSIQMSLINLGEDKLTNALYLIFTILVSLFCPLFSGLAR